MKTPEEIKADAATCITKPPHAMCDRFDLNKKCKGDCGYVIKELYDLVLHYESRLAQVERERDALMESVKGCCETCAFVGDCTKHDPDPTSTGAWWYDDCEEWQWRGVCPENTKEEN